MEQIEIKIVDSQEWRGADGQLMVTYWCMITIGNRKFSRTFIKEKEKKEKAK